MKNGLKWISGIILCLGGLGLTFNGGIAIVSGLLFIIAGLVCIPKTLELIEKKLSKTLDSKTKYAIVIGCWFIGSIIIPKDKMNSSKQNDKAEISTAIDDSSSIDNKAISELFSEDDKELKAMIERELKSDVWTKGLNITSIENLEGVQINYVLLAAWSKTIIEGEGSANKEINSLAEELRKKAMKLQVSEFPKIRKAYAKFVGQKVWEENIDITIGGERNTTITLISGMFANRKNIVQTQTQISETLQSYRFKRVQYKWYKGDDDYTYYDITPPSDSELVIIKTDE